LTIPSVVTINEKHPRMLKSVEGRTLTVLRKNFKFS
jgi:hypothetical protein